MKIILVLISGLFMFLVGNMTKWMMPYLQSQGIPDWVYNNIVFYSILYTAAAGLNAAFIKRFIDDSELRKSNKELKAKLNKAKREYQKDIQANMARTNQSHDNRVLALSCRIKELEAEVVKNEKLIDELGGNLLLQIEKTTRLRLNATREYNKDGAENSNGEGINTYQEFRKQSSKG